MQLTELNTSQYISLTKLVEIYDSLLETFKGFLNDFSELNEAISVPVEGDLYQQMDEISKRFDAAKRGLGIVSSKRFPVGPEKQKHMSRILGNLNVIRGMMARVTKQVAASEEQFDRASQDYEMGGDSGREGSSPAMRSREHKAMYNPHDMPGNPPLRDMKKFSSSLIPAGMEQEEMEVCEDCGHSPCSCMHEECPVCTREVCIC